METRKLWKKFYGPSTLRKGIEKSRNLMTVRVAQKVGFEKISKITNNLGIYNDIPELLSVSLGSAETTLVKLNKCLLLHLLMEEKK